MSSSGTSTGTTLQLQVQRAGGATNLPYPLETFPVRTGLVSRYPTGRIIWSEDFETPGSQQSWWTIDGDSYRTARSALRAHTGRYSLHMHNSQSGSILDCARTIPLDSPNTTKLGLEWWMAYENQLVSSSNSAIGFALEHWDGVNYNEFQCFYVTGTPPTFTLNWDNRGNGPLTNVTGGRFLAPYDPSGSATVVGFAISQAWHHWKLIANISTNKWVTLYVDNQQFDLTPLNLGAVTGGSLSTNSQDVGQIRMEAHLIPNNFTGGQNQPAEVFYDDIVLTDET